MRVLTTILQLMVFVVISRCKDDKSKEVAQKAQPRVDKAYSYTSVYSKGMTRMPYSFGGFIPHYTIHDMGPRQKSYLNFDEEHYADDDQYHYDEPDEPETDDYDHKDDSEYHSYYEPKHQVEYNNRYEPKFKPTFLNHYEPKHKPISFGAPKIKPDPVFYGHYYKRKPKMVLHKHVHQGHVLHKHKHEGENQHHHKHEGNQHHDHKHNGHAKHEHKHIGDAKHEHKHSGNGMHSHYHKGNADHHHHHSGEGKHEHKHQGQAGHKHQHKGNAEHEHKHFAYGDHKHYHSGKGKHEHVHHGHAGHKHEHKGEGHHSHKHSGNAHNEHKHYGSGKNEHKHYGGGNHEHKHYGSGQHQHKHLSGGFYEHSHKGKGFLEHNHKGKISSSHNSHPFPKEEKHSDFFNFEGFHSFEERKDHQSHPDIVFYGSDPNLYNYFMHKKEIIQRKSDETNNPTHLREKRSNRPEYSPQYKNQEQIIYGGRNKFAGVKYNPVQSRRQQHSSPAKSERAVSYKPSKTNKHEDENDSSEDYYSKDDVYAMHGASYHYHEPNTVSITSNRNYQDSKQNSNQRERDESQENTLPSRSKGYVPKYKNQKQPSSSEYTSDEYDDSDYEVPKRVYVPEDRPEYKQRISNKHQFTLYTNKDSYPSAGHQVASDLGKQVFASGEGEKPHLIQYNVVHADSDKPSMSYFSQLRTIS